MDCMNEDHAIKVLESAGLLNPLLFDPVQDTRLLMQRLDGENRFKEKLDRAFYYEVHLMGCKTIPYSMNTKVEFMGVDIE